MIETVAEAPQTPTGVIAALRHEHDTAQLAEARKVALAVDWAALHPAESIDTAAGWPVPGAERDRPLAGPGTPSVAEFCVADLAAALGISTDAARSYFGAALELAHRLPRLYARVMSGDLPAWRARRVAERTSHLPTAGAAWVDRHLAPSRTKSGSRPSNASPTASTSTTPCEPAPRPRRTSAQPSPWTNAEPTPPATWPAPNSPSTSPTTPPTPHPQQRHPHPHQRRKRRQHRPRHRPGSGRRPARSSSTSTSPAPP